MLRSIKQTSLALLAAAALSVSALPAGAQVTPAPARTPLPPQNAPAEREERAGMRPASDVLGRITEGAGGPVALADSSVAGIRVPLPDAAITPANFEQQIAAVVKALPEGTTWAKLYVPAPANGRWNGDDVAAFAFAQAKLVGTVGAAPSGTVEILGRRLSESAAQPYVTGLNLKPVYLVTNPRLRTAATNRSNGNAADANSAWNQMTPQQRQAYAQQQAARLMNADPAVRRQLLQQMRQQPGGDAMLRDMMRSMSPDQRRQLFQNRGRSNP